MEENTTLTCYIHPDRETMLRCNRCEKPICTSCAVLTPTGYRCKQCVRGQQKIFDSAKSMDYIIAPLAAALLSYAGSHLVRFFGIFTLLAAPLAGMVIVAAVQRLTGYRRSKKLFTLTIVGTVLGGLPLLAIALLRILLGLGAGGINLFSLLPLIYQAGYLILVTGSVRYRLMGISV
jgi:hypothetical protein